MESSCVVVVECLCVGVELVELAELEELVEAEVVIVESGRVSSGGRRRRQSSELRSWEEDSTAAPREVPSFLWGFVCVFVALVREVNLNKCL